MHSTAFRPSHKPTRQRSGIWLAACWICVASLQGCGATLPASPPASSELPSPPSLSTPQPAQPYSKQWQQEVDAWQKLVQDSRDKLRGTQLMRN